MRKLAWVIRISQHTAHPVKYLFIDDNNSNTGFAVGFKLKSQFGMDPLDELCHILIAELKYNTDLTDAEIDAAIALLRQEEKNA